MVVFLCPSISAGEEQIEIERLKSLYPDTALVENRQPRAVIVIPSDGRYGTDVSILQDRIKLLTGVELPVHLDDVSPGEILLARNVIALGNMATNRFIEQLYRQWYVLLDLKYPGEGGYVVRSLHNPYGTGHNVIFIGGSDADGVEEAAGKFAALLKPSNPLRVGWLMEIKLGEGINPPEIGDDIPDWVVSTVGAIAGAKQRGVVLQVIIHQRFLAGILSVLPAYCTI